MKCVHRRCAAGLNLSTQLNTPLTNRQVRDPGSPLRFRFRSDNERSSEALDVKLCVLCHRTPGGRGSQPPTRETPKVDAQSLLPPQRGSASRCRPRVHKFHSACIQLPDGGKTDILDIFVRSRDIEALGSRSFLLRHSVKGGEHEMKSILSSAKRGLVRTGHTRHPVTGRTSRSCSSSNGQNCRCWIPPSQTCRLRGTTTGSFDEIFNWVMVKTDALNRTRRGHTVDDILI